MRLVLGLVLASAVAVTFVAAGSAKHVVIIRVRSIATSTGGQDMAPAGPSKGDVLLQHDRLVNVARAFGKGAGATVGSDYAKSTFTSATGGEIAGAATLPGGTILFKGKFTTAQTTATIAVIGGSGKYTNAKGTVAAAAGANPLNIYRLTLP